MIEVTDKARQELKRILVETTDMPQGRLRLLYRGKGELGLGIDIEMPTDESIEHEGSTVLVVEHELALSLQGITLDANDTPIGPELVICSASSKH